MQTSSISLTERKKDIFLLRSEGKTLQEIGNKYGITRERVRQILDIRQNRKRIDRKRKKQRASLSTSV